MNPRFKEILALSVRDRLKLLRAIVDSLEEDAERIRLSPAQERELDRRMRAYRRNPSAARTWEEVQERMRQREGPFASLPRRKQT
ncbi:MAG TPA: addiction module protein [Planctomycetota bacterium]|nr:addiction module protein [Planctomycetota bacterium]